MFIVMCFINIKKVIVKSLNNVVWVAKNITKLNLMRNKKKMTLH